MLRVQPCLGEGNAEAGDEGGRGRHGGESSLLGRREIVEEWIGVANGVGEAANVGGFDRPADRLGYMSHQGCLERHVQHPPQLNLAWRIIPRPPRHMAMRSTWGSYSPFLRPAG